MIDARTSVINVRLAGIKRIVAVSSGKGGVGKSVIATALALSLAKDGCRVGLFDLDFTGPSTHIIMGVSKNMQPKEEKGIEPPLINGLSFMSLVYFLGDNPAPFRGIDVSNSLIELLSITQWGNLDYLIIDMPPGIGDAVLDLIRIVKRLEFIIVTTPSTLAFEVVKKQVTLLCDLNMRILGIIENMKRDASSTVNLEACKLGLNYLGSIAYDAQVEASIGNPSSLLCTALGKDLKSIREQLG